MNKKSKIMSDFIESIKKHPFILLSSIVGAFGIVNVVDSAYLSIFNVQGALPDWFRQLLNLFRAVIHPVYDIISGLLNITLPGILREYFTMGLIVMGMRLRSTNVIYKELKKTNAKKNKYEEKIAFNLNIVVRKNSNLITWAWFYSYRLIYAFLLWPFKLGGAIVRYVTGKKKPVVAGQYEIFFMSVIIAVSIIFSLIIFKALGCY